MYTALFTLRTVYSIKTETFYGRGTGMNLLIYPYGRTYLFMACVRE